MKEKRVKLLFLLFLISFCLMFLRSFQLQVVDWEQYTLKVQDISTRILVEQPERGKIYDRNGKLLAWNEKIYQISNLGGILKEDTEKKLYSILKDSVDNPNTVIDKLNFQKKVILNINSVQALKIANLDSNLVVQEKYLRKYAHESLYHVLGYVDNEGYPRTGLEMVYDEKLRGNYGYNMLIMSSSKGSTQLVEKTHSIPGNNIVLSLDLDLQIKAYNYMKDSNHNGVILISDPNTGEILVFVSYPSPDPNMFSEGMNSLEYKKILNDKNKILVNRAVSSCYPPGSIIKPFIAYSALEAGVSPYATINSTGIYYLKNANGVIIDQLEDWNPQGHGETNLIKSIRASVNSYYYWLGENLGIDYLEGYADKFKLVEPTSIDIPFEKRGNFPGRKWKLDNLGEVWYPGETLRVYIGQSATTMTPIQILRMYNILATRGTYYKFNLFMKEEDFLGNIINKYEPILIDKYELNNDYLKYIYQGMIEVTTFEGPTYEQGTAFPAFKDFPIAVAGKTGTAQVDREKHSHSWFAGFLPANNPHYSIVVFIEYGGMGSDTAAPVARKILDDLIINYY